MDYNIRKLQNYAISNNGLIFDPDTGSIFTTNQTGLSILTLLKSGWELEAIKQHLLAEFEVPEPAVLEKDLNDFINQLTYLGILEQAHA